ncbi:MAG: preprotein translocase subunit Sec61beta [Candidatus Marsarchaeota archaeon]|nr:preprotein translocase subunit Sec61beta [Candidatus Marsarchaeota archaeon]MCL5105941.1 preprotein translocase subunit Sec61beta [Candidatus Marsarchaeota archaeon]
MVELSSPQSQAGVMSFYDAPSKGPKINPKIILIAISLFAIIISVINRIIKI